MLSLDRLADLRTIEGRVREECGEGQPLIFHGANWGRLYETER